MPKDAAPLPEAKKPAMVPAYTTIPNEVELALLFGAEREGRTYAGHLRFVLAAWAKLNPAPKGWVPPVA